MFLKRSLILQFLLCLVLLVFIGSASLYLYLPTYIESEILPQFFQKAGIRKFGYIESPKSIFLKKSGFKWCNGHVYTHAIRIESRKSDYNIILYCDRLKLAEILEQLGVAKAGGDGTVNGRIPLKFEKGKLIFDDGFLYSTPGDGGKVRLTGTEILTAGIPKNTPQYSQLEFAREALESFN